MAVPVAMWHAEQLAVLAEKGEIAAPCIDADRIRNYAHRRKFLQTQEYLIIQSCYIPEQMASHRNHRISEPGQLRHIYLLSIKGCKHGSSACRAQIDCKKMFHINNILLFIL